MFYFFYLFIFLLLRGVQLKNPFYSIWASDIGTELAVSFLWPNVEHSLGRNDDSGDPMAK